MRSIMVMITLVLSIFAIEDRPRFHLPLANRQFWNSSSVVESISSSSTKTLTTEETKTVALSNIVELSLSWSKDQPVIGSQETLPPSGVLITPTTTGFSKTSRPEIDSSLSTSLTKSWDALSLPSSTVLKTTRPSGSATVVDTASSTSMDIVTALDGLHGTIRKTIKSESSTTRIPSANYQGSKVTDSTSPYRRPNTSAYPFSETTKRATAPIAVTTTSSVVTSDWIGTSIYFQPTSTGTGMPGAGSRSSGIPSSLPQVIAPLTGIPDAPAGSTLIHVGFSYELNYKFVVSNSLSSAQIFMYLPRGISYGLGLDASNVIMHSLTPYDTVTSLGYVTTLAFAYIPSSAVETLQTLIHLPLSSLYSTPSGPVNTIMRYLNPTISIQDSSGLSSNESANTKSKGSTSAATVSKQNQPQVGKTTTAGIAVGAVLAAAASSGAILFILRRYKNRSYKSTLGSSKVVDSTHASMANGLCMSGGRQSPTFELSQSNDRSGISSPKEVRNTLGWY